MKSPVDILRTYWGYAHFRKNQDRIIAQVLDGKDILALLPTGGGKSICYQVPGLIMEGICLVISPLIALMLDQISELKRRGVKAIAITSGMSRAQIDRELDNAIYGKVAFLYVSPERLKSRLFIARLQKMNVSLIAVDEAHCIVEWGYDFRPAYRHIADIRSYCPQAPVIALTATATPDVVVAIQDALQFKEKRVIRDSFLRENLTYAVVVSDSKWNRMMEYLKGRQATDSGIVYCSTRRMVKHLCGQLLQLGFSADYYHGGLRFEQRQEKQLSWQQGKTRIMVCTNAFGMGINKPDVRFVIHYHIPETVEAYFQEAGRAGRDEQAAEALLVAERAEIDQLKQRIASNYPPVEFIRSVYHALGNYLQLAIGAGKDTTYPFELSSFCERYRFQLKKTYRALKLLELAEYIHLNEGADTPSQFSFTADYASLYALQVRQPSVDQLVQHISRTQTGVFERLVPIDEVGMARQMSWDTHRVVKHLQFLQGAGVAEYVPRVGQGAVHYLTERLPVEHLSLPPTVYHNRRENALKKAEAVTRLLQLDTCHQQYVLHYFGETAALPCGRCPNCLSREKKQMSVDVRTAVSNYLTRQLCGMAEVAVQDMLAYLCAYDRKELLEQLRLLVEQRLFATDPSGRKVIAVSP